MNKEKKSKWCNIKFFSAKVAQVVVAVGGTATISSCTIWLHEKKVPSELLSNHPFAKED